MSNSSNRPPLPPFTLETAKAKVQAACVWHDISQFHSDRGFTFLLLVLPGRKFACDIS